MSIRSGSVCGVGRNNFFPARGCLFLAGIFFFNFAIEMFSGYVKSLGLSVDGQMRIFVSRSSSNPSSVYPSIVTFKSHIFPLVPMGIKGLCSSLLRVRNSIRIRDVISRNTIVLRSWLFCLTIFHIHGGHSLYSMTMLNPTRMPYARLFSLIGNSCCSVRTAWAMEYSMRM